MKNRKKRGKKEKKGGKKQSGGFFGANPAYVASKTMDDKRIFT